MFHGDTVSVGDSGRALEMMVMAAQQRGCASCHKTAHLNMVKAANFVRWTIYHNFEFFKNISLEPSVRRC